MTNWRFAPDTSDLGHDSGAFFQIVGVRVRTNYGPVEAWDQPIILQPEVGILGFLATRVGGILHLLTQAKMEPGNVNVVQVSPTLQATRSNFTRRHGGSEPPFLDYFLDLTRHPVLVDQLQSEHNARFLQKRNRNVVIEVPAGSVPCESENFRWLTLPEVSSLLRHDNVVNMDARTVLSAIPAYESLAEMHRNDFISGVLESERAATSQHTTAELMSWLASMKTMFQLDVKRVPLQAIRPWTVSDRSIEHPEQRFFSVVGVSVQSPSREVSEWCQPLLEPRGIGVVAFVCQRRQGVLHFLVQARVEAGTLHLVELAPTVQCTPANYEHAPRFLDLVSEADPDSVRFDAVQSEEGGRFLHNQNRHVIIELDPKPALEAPESYVWMTLRQMKALIGLNNVFNIEARSLVACLAAGTCDARSPS